MACSGPGATNLVTAIADARLDSIPLVCITGQVPASMIGTDAFGEVDTYGISIPITKHNYLVRHISELPQVMSDAFRIAQSGRPGPVWIDIPKDIQTAVFDIEEMPEPAQKMAAPAFSQDSIRDAAAMINAAKRPVLYLGGGVINAPERVRELAEKAKLPTTMTLMALGMLPKAHPLSLGMLGMHGARSTNFILQEADLLIVPAHVLMTGRLVKPNSSARMPKSFTWILTARSWVKSNSRTWRSGQMSMRFWHN